MICDNCGKNFLGLSTCQKCTDELRTDSARLDWLLANCILFNPGRDKPLIETRNGIDGAMTAEQRVGGGE